MPEDPMPPTEPTATLRTALEGVARYTPRCAPDAPPMVEDPLGNWVARRDVLYALATSQADDPNYITCGIDGCDFAVERGEGRTMALHQSEDHE